MTIDPITIIGAIGVLSTLLLYFLRSFATGDILSKNVVRREDYERVLVINEGYATKFGEQTEAVKTLSQAVATLATAETRRKV